MLSVFLVNGFWMSVNGCGTFGNESVMSVHGNDGSANQFMEIVNAFRVSVHEYGTSFFENGRCVNENGNCVHENGGLSNAVADAVEP
jgi:hypothetical protein